MVRNFSRRRARKCVSRSIRGEETGNSEKNFTGKPKKGPCGKKRGTVFKKSNWSEEKKKKQSQI